MSDSETKTQYAYVSGIVQAFTKNGVKQPAVRVGDANGQTVYNVKIKTANQNIVDIAMWSGDWGDTPAAIEEGFIIHADGAVKQDPNPNDPTKPYTSVTMYRGAILKGLTKLPREVVNAQPAAAVGSAATGANASSPFSF
jgi:hypothetical protein